MFSDSVLEKIFAMQDMQMLDLQTQSNIVHCIEKIMEEEEKKNAEINSAQEDVKIDAIFGAVDDDTKTSDTLDFGSMFC